MLYDKPQSGKASPVAPITCSFFADWSLMRPRYSFQGGRGAGGAGKQRGGGEKEAFGF